MIQYTGQDATSQDSMESVAKMTPEMNREFIEFRLHLYIYKIVHNIVMRDMAFITVMAFL